MEYNKLNIFYLALTEKDHFRLPFELSFEQVSLETQLQPVFGKISPHSSVNLFKQVGKLKVQEIIRIICYSVEIVKAFKQIVKGFRQTISSECLGKTLER